MKRKPPTPEQDRAHEQRLTLIARPFRLCRQMGRSYPWAGVLIVRNDFFVPDRITQQTVPSLSWQEAMDAL